MEITQQAELPVITKTYDLIREMTRRTSKLPRDLKFVLGDRMLNTVWDIFEALLSARYSKDKRDFLNKANLNLERLRFQVRFCYDEKLISEKQYAYICAMLLETGSMVGGWIKSIKT